MKDRQNAARAGKKPSGAVLAADGLLLLCALYGGVWAACSSYGLNVDTGRLLVACLLCTAVSLFTWSGFRHHWAASLVLLAILAGVAWLFRDTVSDGYAMLADAVETVTRMDVPVPEGWRPGTLEDLEHFLFLATAVLSLLVGWSVVRLHSMSMTFLLTGAWSLPAIAMDAMPDLFPLMLLLGALCTILLSGLCTRHDAVGAARFSLLCLPAVAGFLALFCLLLPPDGYQQPEWTEDVRVRLDHAAEELLQGSVLDGVSAALSDGSDQPEVSLESAGPREFQDEVVLHIQTDASGTIYLRGVSSAVYTGNSWEPLDEAAYEEIDLEPGGSGEALNGYEPLNFPAMTAASGEYCEMTIRYNSLSGCMYTPYQLATTPDEISHVEFVTDSHLERDLGIREKNLYFYPSALPDTQMQPLPWKAAQAEAEYRAFVYDHYLDVPPDLLPVLEDLTRQFTEAMQSMVAQGVVPETRFPYWIQVMASSTIARILANTAEYDLETPYTPEGEDFVEYFLTSSHRGYCVHFASAGALLLRTAGIPARYVTGYKVDVPESGEADVLDSDAHAWVEIYLDGYGWYPVEMTPASGTGPGEVQTVMEGVGTALQGPEETRPEPQQPPSGPESAGRPEIQPETAPEQPAVSGTDEAPAAQEPERTGWKWLLLLVPAAACAPVRSLVCQCLRRRRFHQTGTNEAVIAAYGYWEKLSAWGADPVPELERLARRARFSQHRLTESERKEALTALLVERLRLDGKLPNWKRWWMRWVRGL